MNRPLRLYLTALPAALALAGCASSSTEFPSLAIRDAERVSGEIAVPSGPAQPLPLAPTLAQLDPLMAAVREGHARFVSQAPAAQRAVAAARGAAVGAESWSVAQVAVANLEAQRSQVMIALADLDRLYASAAIEGADVSTTAAALAEANALVAQENAEIDRLLGALAN